MIVQKELIVEAKNKLGKEAAHIIAKDLKIKEWDEYSLKGCCPIHDEDTPSFIWDSKKDSNFFKCFGCGAKVDIIDHYISFYKLTFLEAVEKLFRSVDMNHTFNLRGVKTQKEYNYPRYSVSDSRESVNDYAKSRAISQETLDYCGITQSSNNLMMFNFYDENDVLLTVKCRLPRKNKPGEPKEWYLPNYDNSPILFNMNKIDPTQPLVITEGEMDTLACIESGYKNTVSIPGGTENLKFIETCYDWLEQFDKIILFFDNDAPGVKARKEVASRLGVWRVLYVDLPSEKYTPDGVLRKIKDANEVLYYFGKQDVLDLINDAQEIPIVGIQDLANVEDFDIEKASGLYPNIKPINEIVYKFLFGSVLLVTGLRGSGKSSLINQIFVCESLNQGQDVFMFSGELSAPVLKSWIELTMAGKEKIKMKDEFIHLIEPDAKKQMREWYQGRIWVYDETSNHIDDVLSRAISSTRKYGVKVWILDNLMTLDIGAGDNNVLQKQKEFIVKLNKLAIMYGVLVVLVTHPRKLANGTELSGDDVSGASEITNLAQYLMSVKRYSKKDKEGERDNKGNYRKGKEPIEHDVEISILKNRYTGKVDAAKVYFDYSSYRFYSQNSELYKRYKWNKDTSPIPKDDQKNTPDFMKGGNN